MRWKKKENISFHQMHREQFNTDKKGANDCIITVLPNLIENYGGGGETFIIKL